MPTYEYRCRACGHEFERFQKISEPPVRRCPECGKRRVERLIGAGGGLVFKGPGFYATDYRPKPPRKEDGGAKKADRGGEGKTSGDAGGSAGKSTGSDD